MSDFDGLIAIHKPRGPSSSHVVVQIKKITGVKRVGHAGTLDPQASGVLVVGIGRDATKKLWGAPLHEKEYTATIFFGAESSTDDVEGVIAMGPDVPPPSESVLKSVLEKFVGMILQTPPAYSALKISGTPAYKLARAGKAPQMRPREVRIIAIELMYYAWPHARVKVTCGPGVYIRALARDLGRALGCGAYLQELVRTRVGGFILDESLTLEQFETEWKIQQPQ